MNKQYREIKFRAWNKVTNMMYEDILSPRNWSYSFLNTDIFIWLEWTGLKDKNGKEVYEGDIIRNEIFLLEIVFELGCFSGKILKIYKKSIGYNVGQTPPMYDFLLSSLKIIGNIYQNHELLNKST